MFVSLENWRRQPPPMLSAWEKTLAELSHFCGSTMASPITSITRWITAELAAQCKHQPVSRLWQRWLYAEGKVGFCQGRKTRESDFIPWGEGGGGEPHGWDWLSDNAERRANKGELIGGFETEKPKRKERWENGGDGSRTWAGRRTDAPPLRIAVPADDPAPCLAPGKKEERRLVHATASNITWASRPRVCVCNYRADWGSPKATDWGFRVSFCWELFFFFLFFLKVGGRASSPPKIRLLHIATHTHSASHLHHISISFSSCLTLHFSGLLVNSL